MTRWCRSLHFTSMHAGIMAEREGLSAQDFLAALSSLHIPSLEENRTQLGGPQPALLETAARLQGVMLSQNLLQRKVALDALFHATALSGIRDKR